ncbi:MAG: uroporphyrinogen decarboxylase family protein [Oscillospiraceae bacterium]|nr:uroporphyrinogen decarboxylase family protein [Oscillospiraceae bacterium]
MSYKYGMAALNLEMPDVVPRTEYSVTGHYDLIKKLTGIDGTLPGKAGEAALAITKLWEFSINWNVLIGSQIFGKWQTSMGHAEYAHGGTDRNDNIYCPFSDEEEVFGFDPCEKLGEADIGEWTKNFDAHYQNQQNHYSDIVNMTGIYTTCMSGLIAIFGWDMLLSCAGSDPKRFGEMTDRYCEWMKRYFAALAKSNSPVVMIHDDIVWTEGAFIHPDWYRKYIFPNYKKMFAPLIEAKKKILYTSDGDYTEFVDDIVECGVECFVLEPLTDMEYIAKKHGKTHSFIGNADTRVLLSGTRDDIYTEVKRCMDIGKSCPGFVMAVGNHIPANTPVDNCLYYNDFYMQLRKR